MKTEYSRLSAQSLILLRYGNSWLMHYGPVFFIQVWPVDRVLLFFLQRKKNDHGLTGIREQALSHEGFEMPHWT